MKHVCPNCGKLVNYLPYGKMAAAVVTGVFGAKVAKSVWGIGLIGVVTFGIGSMVDAIRKICPTCGVLIQAVA